MSTANELHERQALLQQLRETGDPAALAEAAKLQRVYHDDEMAGLAADVYASAMHKGTPPTGWTRASELLREGRLEELYQRMPELAKIPKGQLLDYLQPSDSGFRAEIYLPDPAVLGEGYRPVVVPKGSAGSVAGPDGKLHDTTMEDFLANNFPQSVGLKTDYYDKAMGLARRLDLEGANVEYAGHSLAGGMASAMSAVTGQPATTFNAAGLHPETARRFLQEIDPGTQVFDVGQRVASYQVAGEFLGDGVQHNIDRLDALHRRELAGVLKEMNDWIDHTPDGRALMTRGLAKLLPENAQAQAAVGQFVRTLADGDVDRMLKELPLAAGTVHVIPAMREDGSRLVARDDWKSLTELSNLAGPVLQVAYAASVGAHVGHTAGTVPMAAGQVASHMLDASGDVVRTGTHKAADFSNVVSGFTGDAAQAAVRAGGEGLARTREAAGRVEAAVDHAQGAVQDKAAWAGASVLDGIGNIDLLPDSWQRGLHGQAEELRHDGHAARARNQVEAAEAAQHARHDAQGYRTAAEAGARSVDRIVSNVQHVQRVALEGAGERVDAGLDTAGHLVRETARHAPTIGAAAGAATTGGLVAGTHASDAVSLAKTAGLVAGAAPSGNEAFQRHLSGTFVPSVEAQVDREEASARKLLESLRERQHVETPQAPAAAADITQRDHPGHARYQQALDAIERSPNIPPGTFAGERLQQAAANLAFASLAGAERPQGGPNEHLDRIDFVVFNKDRSGLIAGQGDIGDPTSKLAFLPAAQDNATTLTQASQQVQDTLTQQQTQAQAVAQQQMLPTQDDPGPKGPRLS
jgi:hypothetical protein